MYATPSVGEKTVEGPKASTAWKDGLETTRLEGVHLGKSECG